jgi:hypothetical protein
VDRRHATAIAYQFSGRKTVRSAGAGSGMPNGIYSCADGYVDFTVAGLYPDRVTDMIGEEWAQDPRYLDPNNRLNPEIIDEWNAQFIVWCLERTKREIWAEARRAKVLCGPLFSMEDIFADEHFRGRGFWQTVNHPALGPFEMPGRPFLMPEGGYQLRRPAPLMGEHTGEVLAEHGRTPPPDPLPSGAGEGETTSTDAGQDSPSPAELGRGPGGGVTPRALASGISSPWDLTPWQGGIAVAEAGRHRLWWIAPDGAADVLAGTSGENIVDGPALEALLAQPSGLSVSADGTTLFFADSEVSALRQLRDGAITTLAGKGLFEWGTADGDTETARLQHPLGVAAAPDGSVYVADTFNSLLRVWRDGRLSTLPVEGLDEPGGLCLLPDGRLAVADTNNHRILLVDPVTGASERLPLPDADDPDQPAPRALPERAAVTVTLSLDLEGDELDPRDGPPVRISVTAEPASLLGPGPRAWAEDSLPVRVQLRTGHGEGDLRFDLQAASCLGQECHIHRRRITLPVRLGADAETGEIVLWRDGPHPRPLSRHDGRGEPASTLSVRLTVGIPPPNHAPKFAVT